MRLTVQTALLFAALWIVLKMGMFWAGMEDSQIPGAMLNILCLLMSVSIGLYRVKSRRTEHINALGDIKDAMSAGLPYTLIVSGFIYFFYANIDREFTDHKISERLTAVEKKLAEPGEWEQFKKDYPDYETYSKEQFMKEEKSKIEAANNPRSVFVMSLLGGLMLGTFYSILVTAIYRKLIFRHST